MRLTYCKQCNSTEQLTRGNTTCAACKSKLFYKCSECCRLFEQSNLLYRHIHRRHGVSIFMCNNCSRKFSFVGDLNDHTKFCGQEPSFECKFCLYKARHKYSIKNHMKNMHNDNRQMFSCNQCGIKFKINKSLKNHLKLGCTQRKC